MKGVAPESGDVVHLPWQTAPAPAPHDQLLKNMLIMLLMLHKHLGMATSCNIVQGSIAGVLVSYLLMASILPVTVLQLFHAAQLPVLACTFPAVSVQCTRWLARSIDHRRCQPQLCLPFHAVSPAVQSSCCLIGRVLSGHCVSAVLLQGSRVGWHAYMLGSRLS